MREYRNAKNDKYDENNNTLEKILEIELTENENNQNKKIINEIIKIFIESNLTATESRNILDLESAILTNFKKLSQKSH